MEGKKEKGIRRQGTSDSTPKKFGENVKELLYSYSESDLMEKDFNNLKPSERVKFLHDMAQYYMSKVNTEPVKKEDHPYYTMYDALRAAFPDFYGKLDE